jgi:hypothetical protein
MSRARQNGRALLPASRGLLLADTEHAGRTWGAEWAVNLIGTSIHPSIHPFPVLLLLFPHASFTCAPGASPATRCVNMLRTHFVSHRHSALLLFFFSLRAPSYMHQARSGKVSSEHTLFWESVHEQRNSTQETWEEQSLILLPGPTHSIRAINSAGMRSACGAIVPAATGSSRLL